MRRATIGTRRAIVKTRRAIVGKRTIPLMEIARD
jgi:hypothetical protein